MSTAQALAIPGPKIAASVILCTYRRPGLLDACLGSLLGQRVSGDPRDGVHEVIVIDNAPQADGRPVVERWQTAFALRGVPLRCVQEERLGLSFARNRGMAEAAGALIAFIDDDERACEGWLERLLEPFHRLGDAVDIVAGEVEPDFGDLPRPAWLTDDLLHCFSCRWGWDSESRFLREKEWFGEGNCAIRKRLMDGHAFPTDLGRKGDGLLASEGAIFQELRTAGAAAYYVPAAMVFHVIHPDRLDRRWLMRRMFYSGVTDRLTQRLYGKAEQRWDFSVNLAKLSMLDVDSLEGENLKAVSQLYYQLGYASASGMS